MPGSRADSSPAGAGGQVPPGHPAEPVPRALPNAHGRDPPVAGTDRCDPLNPIMKLRRKTGWIALGVAVLSTAMVVPSILPALKNRSLVKALKRKDGVAVRQLLAAGA